MPPDYVETLRTRAAAEIAAREAADAAHRAAEAPYTQFGSPESRAYRLQVAEDNFWAAYRRLTNPAFDYRGLEDFGHALVEYELWREQAGPDADPEPIALTRRRLAEAAGRVTSAEPTSEELAAFDELLDAAREAVA